PPTWDGTEAARKLLSAVYRTGQRFGAAHVVDVLRGNATEKISRNGHDRLSVFGVGAELEPNAWRSVIRQLIVQGYLRVDHEGYGALKLTERSRPLLRGEVALKLRHDTSKPVAAKKPRATDRTVSDEDRELWEALRECRRVLAAE